jgi:hypothetical protein
MNTSSRFQFSLSSLLLIVTFASIVGSMYVIASPVGIALGILAVPTLIRSYIVVRACGASGRAVTNWEKIRLFLTGLVVAYVIAIMTGVAFVAFCVIGELIAPFFLNNGSRLNQPLIIGEWFGGVGSAVVLFLLLRRWFRSPVDGFGVWKVRSSRRDKES